MSREAKPVPMHGTVMFSTLSSQLFTEVHYSRLGNSTGEDIRTSDPPPPFGVLGTHQMTAIGAISLNLAAAGYFHSL